MKTSEPKGRMETERAVKIGVSLVLGLILSVLSFWDLVTEADYPALGSPTLACGVLMLLWGASNGRQSVTKKLWQMILIFLAAAIWILVVGVMISLLPTLIGEIFAFASTWFLLTEVKRRREDKTTDFCFYQNTRK